MFGEKSGSKYSKYISVIKYTSKDMKMIGVIDCNNFFVSCERLFRPDLLGKPVMVLSSNDGCVVARSQEVKDIGIAMGVPVFQIKDIIKDNAITTFSSHFALYRDISSRVFSVVKELFPDMEQYSIDEAFFSFDSLPTAEAESVLLEIKVKIEQLVGIPVSIGLASTKTQAKYANRLAKKNHGVCVIDGVLWEALAPEILLRDIWGVGLQFSRRFTSEQMITVADLIACPKQRLATLFGVVGMRLQAELAGQSQFKIDASHTPKKSIMSSRSFKTKVFSKAIVKDAVAYHIRHASNDLRRQKQSAHKLTIIISPSRHGDYFLHRGVKVIDFSAPTNDLGLLLKEALAAVDLIFEAEVPYNKVGILFSDLVSDTVQQPSLFMEDDHQKKHLLSDIVDALTARFGKDSLVMGKQTKEALWVSRSEKLSPSYTTNWHELAIVQN